MKYIFSLFIAGLIVTLTSCVVPYYNFGYGTYSVCGPLTYYQYPYYEGYCDNYLTFYPTYYYSSCPYHYHNCSRSYPASYNFAYFIKSRHRSCWM